MAAYKQYRAPAGDSQALVDPTWGGLLAQARDRGPRADVSLGGAPLERLAADARRHVVRCATRHASAQGGSPADAPDPDGPLVVSGHQPDLFHPGVWFKNFALDSLARAAGGVGVHLLIDSDLRRATSVRTPTGSVDAPRLVSVAYDRPPAATPFEESLVCDPELFDSFGARAAEAIAPLAPDPMVAAHWPRAVEARRQGATLGEALSAVRRSVETNAGLTTLETPASLACDHESFRRLAVELLLRAPETRDAYNGALGEYRVAHRLRNAAQPLPDLAADGDWVEAPLWTWSDAEPTRRALYARLAKDGVRLTDRHGWEAEGPVDPDGVVEWLATLRNAGRKVRSRALVTTLYCRLVLADLFLHGIGGAKYDQVTDRFAQRLLGVKPPPHATLTATVRLPIEHRAPTQADRRHLVRRLRDLRFHPELFLDAAGDPDAQAKAEWVAIQDPARRAERHHAITDANRRMATRLAGDFEESQRRLRAVEAGLRDAALLESREYAFCLFPERDLVETLHRLAAIPSGA